MIAVVAPAPSPGPPEPAADVQVLTEHRVAIEARLQARFPTLDLVLIRAEVARAATSFDGARITAYLPLLVERRAAGALGRR